MRMRVGVRFRDRVRARAKARVSQLACRGEQHRARREHLAPPVEGRGVVRLCRQQGVSRGLAGGWQGVSRGGRAQGCGRGGRDAVAGAHAGAERLQGWCGRRAVAWLVRAQSGCRVGVGAGRVQGRLRGRAPALRVWRGSAV